MLKADGMIVASKVLMLLNRPQRQARTHALDCRWALGVALPYIEVAAKDIPSDVRRCRRCGGTAIVEGTLCADHTHRRSWAAPSAFGSFSDRLS